MDSLVNKRPLMEEDSEDYMDTDSDFSSRSTDEYEGMNHVAFEYWKDYVVALAQKIWHVNDNEITLEKMRGGSFNRVVGICVHQQWYVLRTPRDGDESCVENDAAALQFIQQHTIIPAPRVLYHQTTPAEGFDHGFIVLNRLAGENLSALYGSLGFEARCQVAHELGVIFRRMLETRSTIAGDIVVSGTQFGVTPFDPFTQSTVLRQRFRDKHLRNKALALPYKNPAPTQSISQWIIQSFNGLKLGLDVVLDKAKHGYRPEDLVLTHLCQAAHEMEEAGWFRNVQYCLFHQDLKIYNLLFDAETPNKVDRLTALDWDCAMFAPSFMACTPPEWAWMKCDFEAGLLPSASDVEPRSAQGIELKTIFERAAGVEYMAYAYHPVYIVARQLVKACLKCWYKADDCESIVQGWRLHRHLRPST